MELGAFRSGRAIFEAKSLRERFPIFSLEFMLAILNDVDEPAAFREEMAKAAAPFIHPKLAAVEVSDKDHRPRHRLDLTKLSDDFGVGQLEARHACPFSFFRGYPLAAGTANSGTLTHFTRPCGAASIGRPVRGSSSMPPSHGPQPSASVNIRSRCCLAPEAVNAPATALAMSSCAPGA